VETKTATANRGCLVELHNRDGVQGHCTAEADQLNRLAITVVLIAFHGDSGANRTHAASLVKSDHRDA